MKKITTAVFSLAMLTATFGYAQEGSKADKKEMKVEKKMMKGKHHKAMKKAVKMQIKDDKSK